MLLFKTTYKCIHPCGCNPKTARIMLVHLFIKHCIASSTFTNSDRERVCFPLLILCGAPACLQSFMEFLWNSLNTEVWGENRLCWHQSFCVLRRKFLGILCLSLKPVSLLETDITARIRNVREAAQWHQQRTVGRQDSSVVYAHEGLYNVISWHGV